MSFLGSALGAVTGLVGGIFQNNSAKGAASSQRAWEEQMSSTAHQREVEDLRKAGLNPILSATGGNGASTPTGATAQVSNPASNFSNDLTSARRLSEVDKKQLALNSDVTKSTVGLNAANVVKANEEAKTQITNQTVNTAYASKLQADTAQSLAQTKAIFQGIKESDSRIPINQKMLAQMDANINLAFAHAGLMGTSSALNLANIEKAGHEIGRIDADTSNIKSDTKLKNQTHTIRTNEENYQVRSGSAPYTPYLRDWMSALMGR